MTSRPWPPSVLSSFLSTNFGYQTGPYQDYADETPSTRYLARLDYNLNDRNKLSVRYSQLDSYTDVLVGARYTAELSPTWKLISRVDGSFGDTDGTFGASMMAAWETDRFDSWAFGYRYMNGELGQDGRDIDVTLHGPVVSYAFGFR